MARKKEYESKATTHSIRFTSRMSIQHDGTYYTVEACEERWLPEDGSADVEKERELLWDTVHGEVEDQIDIIYGVSKKKK